MWEAEASASSLTQFHLFPTTAVTAFQTGQPVSLLRNERAGIPLGTKQLLALISPGKAVVARAEQVHSAQTSPV